MVATGITTNGERESLGINIGDSKNGAFWTEFHSGLRERGLSGVELVVSDVHLGLMAAIAQVFTGRPGSAMDSWAMWSSTLPKPASLCWGATGRAA